MLDTKEGQFPFIDEYDFNTLKNTFLYTSNMKDKKEDLMSIEDFKRRSVSNDSIENEYPNYYFRNIKSKNKLTPITTFKNPFESIKTYTKNNKKRKRWS